MMVDFGKSTSQEVYDVIVELYAKMKKPISLYQLYNWIRFRKRLNLTTNQIKGALRYLFDQGKLKWVREGHLIPSEADNNE